MNANEWYTPEWFESAGKRHVRERLRTTSTTTLKNYFIGYAVVSGMFFLFAMLLISNNHGIETFVAVFLLLYAVISLALTLWPSNVRLNNGSAGVAMLSSLMWAILGTLILLVDKAKVGVIVAMVIASLWRFAVLRQRWNALSKVQVSPLQKGYHGEYLPNNYEPEF